MCVIIHRPKPDVSVPERILDAAEILNPDGFGVTFLDTGETVRTMDYNEARFLIGKHRPMVAHYRYATVGAVGAANCHPFPFRRRGKGYVLYSNGTVKSLGGGKRTDTEDVAGLLAATPRKYWPHLLAMTETRFAIVSEAGEVSRFGAWHVRDGIGYSKRNVFDPVPAAPLGRFDLFGEDGSTDELDEFGHYPDYGDYGDDIVEGDLVAVYGTLKQGHGNHCLLDGAEFVGSGETVKHLRMVDRGIPYVFPGTASDGKRVKVELYRPAGPGQWESLDALEGHPDHYVRRLTMIELEDGSVEEAWLYFAGDGTAAPRKGEALLCRY